MRVALLHTRLSGYIAACLRQFVELSGAELLIYAWPNQPDAPFDVSHFADLGEIRNRREFTVEDIQRALDEFKPDAILTSGWADKGYVKVCRAMRRRGISVIAGCDTQWTGSLRQQVAALTAPWHVRKAIDVLWVTGERQAVLGRALGFRGEQLWEGYYACDWGKFAAVGRDRLGTPVDFESGTARRSVPTFLYVGRYAPEKGLDTLAEAYSIYRKRMENPWRLVCAGAGPLRETLLRAGAEDRGFLQPDELPALMGEASAFILPSRFEPWGVVAHEAAAAGLPLILSDACGAGAHLLRSHGNGYVFPAGEAEMLAERMERISCLDEAKRREFGGAGFQLSKQYTPERWAETLKEGLGSMKRGFTE